MNRKNWLKIIFFLAIIFITIQQGRAQISIGGVPRGWQLQEDLKSGLIRKSLESLDTDKWIQDDLDNGITNRYGVVQQLHIDIKKEGTVRRIAGEGTLWRYALSAGNCYSLGLYFSEYQLPAGADLYIYSPDGKHILGGFNELNHDSLGVLSVAALPGKEAVIEYFEPEGVEPGKLVLGSVTQAYRDIYSIFASTSRIGINCSQGEDWQTDKKAVCKMTFVEGSYSYLCTGFLVNNVRQDGTPYFMTANHCISTSAVATTLVLYFNYENSGCLNSDAPSNYTLSGSTLKATNQYNDFTLLLMDNIPPSSYGAYLAGWDASGRTSQNGICIHHPAGAPKCISIDEDPITSYAGEINWDNEYTSAGNTHWKVGFEYGATEGGSSGSPLFDDHHRVIGQLHGGDNDYSFYGKFNLSWNHSSTSNKQLKVWLDPDKTGTNAMDGITLKTNPVAKFTMTDSLGCLNSEIQLQDKSLYSPQKRRWTISPGTYSFVNGTTANSKYPQVEFTETGLYTVKLVVVNEYGSDSVIRENCIQIVDHADVSFRAITTDSIYCACDLNALPLVAQGTSAYSFSYDQTEKISYTTKDNMLYLSLKDGQKKYGSFDVNIKVTGKIGVCSDQDQVKLHISSPVNDDLQDAIALPLGNHGPYSNFCSSREEDEPNPPFTSCTGLVSWCPESSTYKAEHSIWFTFLGPSNGRITIATKNTDTRIAVYEAESYEYVISGNSSNYTLLAANDNISAGDLSAGIEDLKVKPGKRYYLQVDTKDGATGDIAVNLLANSLEVYPNPSAGVFKVIVSGFDQDKASIEIYNASGEKVIYQELTVSPDSNLIDLNMSHFPPGVYLLKVQTSTGIMKKKIMIVK